jgi:hypothetical protein
MGANLNGGEESRQKVGINTNIFPTKNTNLKEIWSNFHEEKQSLFIAHDNT